MPPTDSMRLSRCCMSWNTC
ncbi:hypothetical protein [Nitrosospira sp. Nsp11]